MVDYRKMIGEDCWKIIMGYKEDMEKRELVDKYFGPLLKHDYSEDLRCYFCRFEEERGLKKHFKNYKMLVNPDMYFRKLHINSYNKLYRYIKNSYSKNPIYLRYRNIGFEDIYNKDRILVLAEEFEVSYDFCKKMYNGWEDDTRRRLKEYKSIRDTTIRIIKYTKQDKKEHYSKFRNCLYCLKKTHTKYLKGIMKDFDGKEYKSVEVRISYHNRKQSRYSNSNTYRLKQKDIEYYSIYVNGNYIRMSQKWMYNKNEVERINRFLKSL